MECVNAEGFLCAIAFAHSGVLHSNADDYADRNEAS